MVIRGMSMPLIISCFVIILILIVLPLVISFKAERKNDEHKSEWDKIKEYGNKINNKTRKKN